MASCGLGAYLLGSRLAGSGAENSSGLGEGSEAPDFLVTSIDGESIRLSDLRQKAVMLNFWATWCGPCVEEMPLLQAYAEKYSQDLVILGINADEPRRDVVKFVEDHGLTFPVFLDPDSRVQDLYNIHAFPTSFFIDREGVIRGFHIGSLSESLLDGYLQDIGVGE